MIHVLILVNFMSIKDNQECNCLNMLSVYIDIEWMMGFVLTNTQLNKLPLVYFLSIPD